MQCRASSFHTQNGPISYFPRINFRCSPSSGGRLIHVNCSRALQRRSDFRSTARGWFAGPGDIGPRPDSGPHGQEDQTDGASVWPCGSAAGDTCVAGRTADGPRGSHHAIRQSQRRPLQPNRGTRLRYPALRVESPQLLRPHQQPPGRRPRPEAHAVIEDPVHRPRMQRLVDEGAHRAQVRELQGPVERGVPGLRRESRVRTSPASRQKTIGACRAHGPGWAWRQTRTSVVGQKRSLSDRLTEVSRSGWECSEHPKAPDRRLSES